MFLIFIWIVYVYDIDYLFIYFYYLFIYLKQFAEQDRGLDSLSKVIARQKQMAVDIGNEVDGQNGKWELVMNPGERVLRPTPDFDFWNFNLTTPPKKLGNLFD